MQEYASAVGQIEPCEEIIYIYHFRYFDYLNDFSYMNYLCYPISKLFLYLFFQYSYYLIITLRLSNAVQSLDEPVTYEEFSV